MKNTMQFAGVIDSEETMAGALPDGRRVYVELLSVYYNAPEGLRDDPGYLAETAQGRGGDFDDDENPPMVWIEGRRP